MRDVVRGVPRAPGRAVDGDRPRHALGHAREHRAIVAARKRIFVPRHQPDHGLDGRLVHELDVAVERGVAHAKAEARVRGVFFRRLFGTVGDAKRAVGDAKRTVGNPAHDARDRGIEERREIAVPRVQFRIDARRVGVEDEVREIEDAQFGLGRVVVHGDAAVSEVAGGHEEHVAEAAVTEIERHLFILLPYGILF